MQPHRFLEVFPRQLRFWSFHATFNALPSLAIAAGWMGLWKNPAAVAGMVAAIATFALGFAVLTSLEGPLSNRESTLGRAVRVGAKVRVWIASLSLPMVAVPPLGFFTPDAWCGLAAIQSLSWLWSLAGQPGTFFNFENASQVTFVPAYITTFTEGLILSVLLFVICFFAVLMIHSKERKKQFEGK